METIHIKSEYWAQFKAYVHKRYEEMIDKGDLSFEDYYNQYCLAHAYAFQVDKGDNTYYTHNRAARRAMKRGR